MQDIVSSYFKNDNFETNVSYRIKAGICYVTIGSAIITSIANERTMIMQNMPIPAIDAYGVVIGDSSGDSLGLLYINAGVSFLTFMPRKNTGTGYGSFSYPIQQ